MFNATLVVIGLVILPTAYLAGWKLLVAEDKVVFSSLLSKGGEPPLSYPAKALLGRGKMEVYHGDKRCFAVESNCPGYGKLQERLHRQGLLFSKQGIF